jgi:hypothetical protein
MYYVPLLVGRFVVVKTHHSKVQINERVHHDRRMSCTGPVHIVVDILALIADAHNAGFFR